MTKNPSYSRLEFSPIADPRAVVILGPARFTILNSRLIRMEYSPDGRFEDRPSQVFWYRHQPVPEFHREETHDRGLVVTTEHLRLAYKGNNEPFGPDTLQIQLLTDGLTWRFGEPDKGNLRGTTRTLDRVSGSTQLEPGLLSREGWVVIDDSRSLVFDEAGWLADRDAPIQTRDLYFFGYGREYKAALRGYLDISGRVPLLPRWALGNWWSRYWAYSSEELRSLMVEFRTHAIPLSVCIVDMDWHLVNVGEGINGWTGYTWNQDLFPDPPAFINWLHDQGLRTALNLHPALGVRPHEAMYPAMAERMGLDPSLGKTIPFDIANPRFTEAYFEVLHHPQEAIGIDFWWMDWQQGTQTAVAGLDPLWWLNHLHFHDLARDGKRPFVFSRWGGLGNHRYPIGFSGDTIVSWESLAFQPFFTATAANVAYGWWSHDIGGHMEGIEDRELYTRWVQFGVFSPIFRLHSTKNQFHERRPWGYDAEVLRITRDAMQLRHALIPYLYTMSRLNEKDGQALVRPMYHDYPEREEAYACPQQYLFGTDLIVAPYTAPADIETRLSRQVVWLPSGGWYHFFSGDFYSGDAWYACYGALEDIPIFARAGAIVPLASAVGWGGVTNPAELHLHIFTGGDGRCTLYEDDGETGNYLEGAYAETRFDQRWDGTRLVFMINPPSGDHSVIPLERSYHLHFYGLAADVRVSVMTEGNSQPLSCQYDAEKEVIHVGPLVIDSATQARININSPAGHPIFAHRARTDETVFKLLAAFRLDSLAKSWINSRTSEIVAHPERLADFGVDLAPSQVRALLEVTQGAGVNIVTDQSDPVLVVLWNNKESAAFRHHFAQLRPEKWFDHERFGSSFGNTPRFKALRPDGKRWRLAVDYFGLHSLSYGSRPGAD